MDVIALTGVRRYMTIRSPARVFGLHCQKEMQSGSSAATASTPVPFPPTKKALFGSGRFCSRACANAHDYTEETRKKIGLSVSKYNKFSNKKVKKYNIKIKEYNENIYYKNPNKCVICGNILTYERRFFKTCCKECCNEYQREIHKNINPVKRSKNEIDFCNLCEEFFGKENVLNNEKLFNGWDADVIIPKYKVAILKLF